MVISKIDHESFTSESAKECLLNKLDTTLYAILQRALGSLESTHIAAMYYKWGLSFFTPATITLMSTLNQQTCPLSRDFFAFMAWNSSWRMAG